MQQRAQQSKRKTRSAPKQTIATMGQPVNGTAYSATQMHYLLARMRRLEEVAQAARAVVVNDSDENRETLKTRLLALV